jgi:hypothetical protein
MFLNGFRTNKSSSPVIRDSAKKVADYDTGNPYSNLESA